MTTEFDAPVRRRARARWRSVALLATTMVAAATLATVAGALIVSARDVWFDNLQRPGWVPTAWGFLIPAAVVYATLGLAGWRIWVRGPGSVALTCWLVLLGLHLAWTVLFFGLWVPRWSLVGAAVLGLMAIITLVAATRTTRLGAWLLVPDLAWVSYLVAVNAVIVAWN